LSCHNVAAHFKFVVSGTVVPNTATASAPAVEIKMATFTGAEHARCMFWFEKTKSDTHVQKKFRIQVFGMTWMDMDMDIHMVGWLVTLDKFLPYVFMTLKICELRGQ
jgi:hypothetical protein